MKPVNLVKEIVVRVQDQKGALSQVLTPLAEAKLNLRSLNLTGFATDGFVRLHAEDHARALDVLKRCNFTVWEQDVLTVEINNEVGGAARVASQLNNAGVDVRGLFASTGTGANTTLYVWTTDYAGAQNALK